MVVLRLKFSDTLTRIKMDVCVGQWKIGTVDVYKGNCCLLQDWIFQAAYSGERTPLPPSDLLQAIWKLEPEFADGGMHDAHDFWLLAVEALRQSRGTARLCAAMDEWGCSHQELGSFRCKMRLK